MKKNIHNLDGKYLKDKYPICDRLSGWYFRINEISIGFYKAEGTDAWGREVSRMGSDPDIILKMIIEDAKKISIVVKQK